MLQGSSTLDIYETLMYLTLYRDVYKAAWCMDTHTSHCAYRHNQAVGQLGQIVKRTALEGACAGDLSQYQCGIRSVMALSASLNQPTVSRAAFC